MNFTVLKAIFKRDFVNYFASATGYVFICVFVVLSSLATFWPDEFFSNNLANLDQLSRWMPFILLVFVPAITMSIWAEERRRGTDELLLTLPATDSDVVIGKYLAGVAIFTVSLLFSMASIRLIFSYGLGDPDPWLFVCTYLGYWFVGLAMLATGMVASFLTSNLTVGFILGMLFNAPQALASLVAGAVVYLQAVPVLSWLAREYEWIPELVEGIVSSFSAFEGFSSFSRGVLSLSGALHFLCIVALMLYLCMVLIGRRHWAGGEEGNALGWHYVGRGLALFLLVGGVNMMLRNHDSVRFDLTEDRINSLSPQTIELVRAIGKEKDTPPIRIDAYLSPQVPSEFAGQKRDLLSVLQELRSVSGGKIAVAQHEVENFSEEATRAERTFGIEARPVTTRVRGTTEEAEIFLGVAFSCGLDKVVIPFLDKGIPVEYEVVRSIATVADQQRKRVGVIKTDVQLFGGFSPQGSTSESQFIVELKKQYEVIEVDPSSPITDTFDVLVAVQPSSLGPEALDNFVAAVKSGQPTAIFEDPLPVVWRGVPGTDEPKQPGGGMMGMFGGGGPPQPKGDMQQLWNLIGARMNGSDLIWQDHNPYESNFPQATEEWVFADIDSGNERAFSLEDDISAGLKQVLFLYSGATRPIDGSKVNFEPLVVTNERTGSLPVRTAQAFLRGIASPTDIVRSRAHTNRSYILAARITGQIEEQEEVRLGESIDDEQLRAELEAAASGAAGDADAADDSTDSEESDDDQSALNVVLVTDIDCLGNEFFAIRALGDDEQMIVDWRFQNVTFVLNILDSLAADDRFIALRKRTRDYRTLTQIESETEEFREQALAEQKKFKEEAEAEIEAAGQRFRDAIAEIESRTDLDPVPKRQLLDEVRIREERIRDVRVTKLEQDRRRQTRQIQRDLLADIRSVQDWYKFAALVVPPIPPILLACWVFFRRRAMEKEGVSQERLRFGKRPTSSEGSDEAA